MPRHHAPDLGISEPNYVPPCCRPDRQYLPVGEPVRGARSHARSRQIAFFILPAAAVAGPDERHVAGDVYALLLAAVLKILFCNGVAGLELIGSLLAATSRRTRGPVWGVSPLRRSMEAARALDAAVYGTSPKSVGRPTGGKARRCGSRMLSTDDDAAAPVRGPASSGLYSSSCRRCKW